MRGGGGEAIHLVRLYWRSESVAAVATTRALEPVALPSFDFELRCPTTIDHRPSAAAATAVVSGSGGKDGGRLDLNLAGKFRTMISRHIQFHVAIIWREEIWRQFTIQALLTRGSPGNHVECHFHSSAPTRKMLTMQTRITDAVHYLI